MHSAKIEILLSVLLAVLILTGTAHAWPDKWDSYDYAGQALMTGSLLVDWGQTNWMAHHNWTWDGKQYYETNRIEGKHPSVGKINSYFTICAVSEVGVSILLPKHVNIFGWEMPLRNTWQIGGTLLELYPDIHNAGFHVGWRF